MIHETQNSGCHSSQPCLNHFHECPVHEQRLACEPAGLHFKKIGQAKAEQDYFQQGKDCYNEWGSQMKVESIHRCTCELCQIGASGFDFSKTGRPYPTSSANRIRVVSNEDSILCISQFYFTQPWTNLHIPRNAK